ncbi:MAG TPA: xanthine dehydrogenase family protein molybdopterin-binding subunit [Vicinamibacterales bacterium]|nr:xanthine dehydrogenase family protein molybdopterin-binding subunit [Vicinamibacterales bacterium]
MARAQQGAPPPAPSGPTADAKKYAWPAKPAVLSTRVKRLDGPDKVTGRAKYSFDMNRPGMIYGKMVRSPHPHARIVSIDLSGAQRAPGVRATLIWKEQGAQVMYQGDPVAAVAADTEELAEDAARMVKVQYDVLQHVANVEQAMASDAPVVFMNGNTRKANTEEVGDIEQGFKQAAHIVEQTYSTHVITHVCMETHGCVCEWDGDKLTAWVTTQGVHGTKDGFAQGLKIPSANVRVITQYMGGGFGSKFGPDAQGLICAQLAKQAGKPVKLFLDRKEEHLDTGNRPSAYAKIRAGVSADGRLTAFDGQSWGTGGAGATSNFPLPYIYNFPNRRRAHTDVYINAGQQRAMRAPGHPQGCFLTEILMDELADRVRMDPVEFRVKNLPEATLSQAWGDYFRQGAKAFGWDKRHATGDPRPGPIKNGFGVSAHRWGGGGRGGHAHCDIAPDGSVVMKVGTQDLGTGTRTLVAMLTAETLGLPVSAVTPEIGDTIYPVCGASGGSTTAASISPAIRIAAGKARDQLFARVAPALGVDADALIAEGGRVSVKGNASKGMTWKDACRRLGAEPVSVDGEWEDGLSSTGTSGVQFTEVDVDIETGIVKVKRILTVQDCGLIVSRLTAESQIHGGIIGSLNFALFEDRILDRVTGQMVNPNMESYLLAGLSDVPKIDIMLVDTPAQRSRGVIGIGEPPTVSTASAIANAVRNATGVTIRSLPLHPHNILRAIEEQKAGGTL